jgi:hypothetical protein
MQGSIQPRNSQCTKHQSLLAIQHNTLKKVGQWQVVWVGWSRVVRVGQ